VESAVTRYKDVVSRLGLALVVLALSGSSACTKTAGERAREAMLLADAGQSREALELLERHLQKEPHALLERRLAVRLSGAVGDLGKAELHAAALARELGPASPVPLLELGHALELTHHYDEALEHYDRASALAPRDPAGPLTGGLRAAAWGEPELSEPRLAEAVRRDPRDARAWHALGLVRARLGDLDGAERAYRSGLTADPRRTDNRVGLATLALLRDDPRAVLSEYDALLAEKPGFADAHLGRSWALVRLGRFAEASRELDRAERLGADRASLTSQRRWLRAEQSKAGKSRTRAATTP
jgi:tetratricopeptide (TPR) repeat protein